MGEERQGQGQAQEKRKSFIPGSTRAYLGISYWYVTPTASHALSLLSVAHLTPRSAAVHTGAGRTRHHPWAVWLQRQERRGDVLGAPSLFL